MTATIRNKVNPWFARVNHVKLPKWSVNKLYVETDGSPVDGGGPTPPDPDLVEIPFTITVGAATNPGYSDYTSNSFGDLTPRQLGSSYCTFFIESISSSDWTMKFGTPGAGYKGGQQFADSPGGFDLTVNGQTVPMTWAAGTSDYRNPAPFPADFSGNVGETYEFVLSYPAPTGLWTPAKIDTVAWFDATDVPIGYVPRWPSKASITSAQDPDLLSVAPGLSTGAGVIFDAGQGMFCDPSDTFGLCVVVYSDLTASQASAGTNANIIPLIDHAILMEAFIYGPAAPDDPDMSLDGGSSGNPTGGGAMANGNEPFISSQDPGFLGYGAVARTSAGSPSMVEYFLDKPFPIIGLATMRGGDFVGGSTIYEVLAFPTSLTDDTRYKVEGYLAWKWGFEDKLPETHLYKNEAPTL